MMSLQNFVVRFWKKFIAILRSFAEPLPFKNKISRNGSQKAVFWERKADSKRTPIQVSQKAEG